MNVDSLSNAIRTVEDDEVALREDDEVALREAREVAMIREALPMWRNIVRRGIITWRRDLDDPRRESGSLGGNKNNEP